MTGTSIVILPMLSCKSFWFYLKRVLPQYLILIGGGFLQYLVFLDIWRRAAPQYGKLVNGRCKDEANAQI